MYAPSRHTSPRGSSFLALMAMETGLKISRYPSPPWFQHVLTRNALHLPFLFSAPLQTFNSYILLAFSELFYSILRTTKAIQRITEISGHNEQTLRNHSGLYNLSVALEFSWIYICTAEYEKE